MVAGYERKVRYHPSTWFDFTFFESRKKYVFFGNNAMKIITLKIYKKTE